MTIRMRAIGTLLLPFSCLFFSSACELLSCSDAGCDVPVMVTFEPVLPAGSYRVEVIADAQVITCVIEVKADGAPGGDCYQSGLSVHQSGFTLQDDPAVLDVKVSSEDPDIDLEVAERFELSYETDYPNGKACGPECRKAPDQTLDTSALVDAVGAGGAGGSN